MKPIERELKCLLTQEQFRQILPQFGNAKNQTNRYYTNDYATKHHIAYRIREIEGKTITTIKLPNDETSHIELESEDEAQIQAWKKTYHLNELEPLTQFTTYRRIIETTDATICLDETHYEKRIDYEIEYEYKVDHDGISKFNQWLKPYGLIWEKNPPTKLARALKK